MHVFFIVLISFLPVCIWSAYGIKSGYITIQTAAVDILRGLAAVIAAVSLGFILAVIFRRFPRVKDDPVFQLFFIYIMQTALIEEGCKMAASRLFFSAGTSATPVKRFFVHAVLVSLSFAAFENLAYAFQTPSVTFLRLITAVPVHAACGLLAANWIIRHERKSTDDSVYQGKIKHSAAEQRSAFLSRGIGLGFNTIEPIKTAADQQGIKPSPRIKGRWDFFIAVILHGLYSFSMPLGGFRTVLAFAIIAALVCYAYYVWKQADRP
ncbi:PrsW family intramembrane metalloprotease [Brucepastera parasyntrophica]|uniref:PrsW family glutamic-type intramembrane protease n=1 Tax=Brucepastera parasyntrophica TaxID=2880008 RepID=UPI00210E3798|nr:PrsW family glutamic-type intramembrane protease [Brucepastera parasyntrophica]ULQ59021.1 PrsW family intramembrane metalloprotease [Brucepastera parasyntrophica]